MSDKMSGISDSLYTIPTGYPERVSIPNDSSFLSSDWKILAGRWFPVARGEDVKFKPVTARLLDVDLVIYRTGETVRVARNVCPHRGVPLSMGWVEGDDLICPYHGLRFAPDGQCVHIPAQPTVKPPERLKATTLPVIERYGLVWTSLNSPAELNDVPPFPEWEDDGFFCVVNPPVDISGAPGRQVEGFIDVAHFAWIHHQSFADRANQIVPDYRVTKTPFGLSSEYTSTVPNVPKSIQYTGPDNFLWRRVFDVYTPFNAILTVSFPDQKILKILNAASPVTARKTRLFVPVARDFDTDGRVEDVYEFNSVIFAEDQAIIEAQTPPDLPLDLGAEGHIAADSASIAYRKTLKQMGLILRAARDSHSS
jgi:vanillate O-demethylase monooxygenase subunit